jgi:single-strand DNA-binding protein
MANFNKVILVGNLTRDPQLKYLPNQTAVVDFGLAINHRWRTASGEQREDTCFIDCSCFGKSAETINQYVRKGQPILVEGRLQFDTWQGQDGQKHSKHRVFVQSFQFMGGPRQGAGAAPEAPAGRSAPPPVEPPPAEPPPPDEDLGRTEMPGGEEIPF